MRGGEILLFPVPSSNLVIEEQLQIKLVTVHKRRRCNLLIRNFTCKWKKEKFTNSKLLSFLKEKNIKMWLVCLKQLEGTSMLFTALRAISLRLCPVDRGTLE